MNGYFGIGICINEDAPITRRIQSFGDQTLVLVALLLRRDFAFRYLSVVYPEPLVGSTLGRPEVTVVGVDAAADNGSNQLILPVRVAVFRATRERYPEGAAEGNACLAGDELVFAEMPRKLDAEHGREIVEQRGVARTRGREERGKIHRGASSRRG